MKIELKNIKFSEWASEETNCFRADIFCDGKKIGYCGNDGHGGSTSTHFYDGCKDKFLAVEAYCNTLPPIVFDKGTENEWSLDMNLEHYVDNLFENWLSAKEDKKLIKNFDKGICYGSKLSYQIVSFKLGNKAATISEIVKHPKGKEFLKTAYDKLINEGKNVLNTNLSFLN